MGTYVYIYLSLYIYIYMVSPPPTKQPTFLTLIATFAPLNQTFVCKTHHTAADMTLRETIKTPKTTKQRKQKKHVFCCFRCF